MFKDDITHAVLPVSPCSASVVTRALVAAHRAGSISDTEYQMTYAEICEPGYLPQAFGGKRVSPAAMAEWITKRVWSL